MKEAIITADLQHPGIVPVHDWGELEDGRLWFTMKEVHGRTLAEVIRGLHPGIPGSAPTSRASAFRRAVEVVHRACEAVAYAHDKGVIHRDLKPSNIMVGDFAEVYVMDWGISTRTSVDREIDVAGTPGYLAPEQEAGQTARPESDVYSLGKILLGLLDVAMSGADVPEHSLLHQLRPIAIRATSEDPDRRFRHADELSTALASWRDGTRRREQALAILRDADLLVPKISRLRADAASRWQAASKALAALPGRPPAHRKAGVWALEDQAARFEREAHVEEVHWLQLLRSALNADEQTPEVHERLANHYHDELLAAEREGRADEAARNETFLRGHDRGGYAAFLRGEGSLSLSTDPQGARVVAYRYVERGKRLVLGDRQDLGSTPLEKTPLRHGSYLLVIRSPGRITLRLPVLIERAREWQHVDPRAGTPAPLRLLPRTSSTAGFVRVTAGWFMSGGDPLATEALTSRRVWIDDFLIGRHPVTNAEYLGFLNALVDDGRTDEAERHVPRAPLGVGADAQRAAPQLERDSFGRFVLSRDAVGRVWLPDHPVCLVDWHSAIAYARWLGRRRGLDVRLPSELEWEKAARGVDGRFWPWGRQTNLSWANVVGSIPEPGPCSISAFPIDSSPYGVRHTAGNLREWCIDLWNLDGPPLEAGVLEEQRPALEDPSWRVARGGSWHTTPELSRLAGRFVAEPFRRFSSLGFRLVAALPRRHDLGPSD